MDLSNTLMDLLCVGDNGSVVDSIQQLQFKTDDAHYNSDDERCKMTVGRL